MSDLKTLTDIPNAISSPELEVGPSPCVWQDGRQMCLFGPEVAHVSHTPQPGKDLQKKIPAISGPTFSDSSRSAILQQLLENRLRRRLGTDGSMEYSMTWKEKTTPAGRSYCQLVASARRTSGSDCSGWPTPQCPNMDSGNSDYSRKVDVAMGLRESVNAPLALFTAKTAKPAASQALNPAFSRWLQGYPSSWDQASPGYDAWQKMQDAFASGGCAGTGTA